MPAPPAGHRFLLISNPLNQTAGSESSPHVEARIARLLLLALSLWALIVVPGFLFPYVTPKAVFLRVIVEIALAVLLLDFCGRETRRGRPRDRILIAFAVFITVNLAAALTGFSVLHSLFGDFERMWGVWGWLHMVIYYVLLRIYLRAGDWTALFRASVIVSAVVAIIVFVQAAGFSWSHVGGSPLGTIGNPGLLASYLLFQIAFASLLAAREPRKQWLLVYGLIGVVDLSALILSGNRSSLAGVFLGVVVAAFVSGKARRLATGGLAALALFFVLARSHDRVGHALPAVVQRAVYTGQSSSEEIRSLQVKTALLGMRDHPLLGAGPENFDLVWARHFDPRIYRLGGDQRFDRAHNAYLEELATSGIAGLASYLALWAVIFLSIRSARRSMRLNIAEHFILVAVMSAYAFYLLFWFADMSSVVPWTLLAAFIGSRDSGTPILVFGSRKQWRPATTAMFGVGVATIAGVIYVHGVQPLRVARALVRVQRDRQAVEDNLADLAFVFSVRAPSDIHKPAIYLSYMEHLAPEFPGTRRDPYRFSKIHSALQSGVSGMDRLIASDSNDPGLYMMRARVSLLAANFYRNKRYAKAAAADVRRAMAISPRRIDPHLVLSGITETLGDSAGAMTEASRAVAIDPQLPEPHYYLGILYLNKENLASSTLELRRSLDRGYIGPATTYDRLGFLLEKQRAITPDSLSEAVRKLRFAVLLSRIAVKE